jgi:hypothetical protein
MPDSSATLSGRARRALLSGTTLVVLAGHAIFQLRGVPPWPPLGSDAVLWTLSTVVLLTFAWLALAFGRPRTAYVLAMFTVIDVGIGAVSVPLRAFHAIPLLPSRDRGAWIAHPLLGLATRPAASGILSSGARWTHDRRGYRGRREHMFMGPTAMVYGGSTTYDTAVEDDSTWVELLHRLDTSIDYVNAGVPGYTATQHIVQTALFTPTRVQCAVYYMGWNDAVWSFGGQDSVLATLPFTLHSWPPPGLRIPFGSPTLSLLLHAAYKPWANRGAPRVDVTTLHQVIDSVRLRQYRRNVEVIASLNAAAGRRWVFIGHPLNYPSLEHSDAREALFALPDSVARPVMTAFNGVARDVAAAKGGAYFDPNTIEFVSSDFVDAGHFTSSGARRFAHAIAPTVQRACAPPPS